MSTANPAEVIATVNTATLYGLTDTDVESNQALTDTDVESNQAWWLAMPGRLASRRRDLGYDDQRAILGLPEVAS